MGQEDSQVECHIPQSSTTDQFQPQSEQVLKTINKIRRRNQFNKLFVDGPEPQHQYVIQPKPVQNKFAFLAKEVRIGDLTNPSALNATNDSIIVYKQKVIQ